MMTISCCTTYWFCIRLHPCRIVHFTELEYDFLLEIFQQRIGIFSLETQRSTVLYIDDHIWAVLCSQTAGSCSSNNLKFDSLTIYLLFTSSLLKDFLSFGISYLVLLYTLHTPFLFSIHTNVNFFSVFPCMVELLLADVLY